MKRKKKKKERKKTDIATFGDLLDALDVIFRVLSTLTNCKSKIKHALIGYYLQIIITHTFTLLLFDALTNAHSLREVWLYKMFFTFTGECAFPRCAPSSFQITVIIHDTQVSRCKQINTRSCVTTLKDIGSQDLSGGRKNNLVWDLTHFQNTIKSILFLEYFFAPL